MNGTLPRPRPPNLSVAARKQHPFVSVSMFINWTVSYKGHVFDLMGHRWLWFNNSISTPSSTNPEYQQWLRAVVTAFAW